MDEVLPDELSKIFATFDRTVASLDKKHASFATSTGKVSAYAPVKSRRITGKGEPLLLVVGMALIIRQVHSSFNNFVFYYHLCNLLVFYIINI